jgi:hypothetical protein
MEIQMNEGSDKRARFEARADGVPIWQVGSRTAAGTCWWDVDKATFDRKVEAGYLESRIVVLVPQAAQP